jgi:hypothetical protein
MKTKLTLSISADILEKARRLSRKRHTTLSAIFEKTILLMEKDKAAAINPKIKALQGILKTGTGKAGKDEFFGQYRKKQLKPGQ